MLITIPHYREVVAQPSLFTDVLANIGLNRHAFERIAYLVPIIWAGFLFGWRGAVAISIIALACMLPRAIFISSSPKDAIRTTLLCHPERQRRVSGFFAPLRMTDGSKVVER
ncbi:MAG: hypothetical protein NTW48_07575 [Chloroflexi bacterium]|nr:hypothetical protein [Chloroflexota bacterium]